MIDVFLKTSFSKLDWGLGRRLAMACASDSPETFLREWGPYLLHWSWQRILTVASLEVKHAKTNTDRRSAGCTSNLVHWDTLASAAFRDEATSLMESQRHEWQLAALAILDTCVHLGSGDSSSGLRVEGAPGDSIAEGDSFCWHRYWVSMVIWSFQFV